MTERLTTLAAVKDWLDITTDGSDSALIRLIDAASQFTLNYLNRDTFKVTDFTENCRGNGKASMLLRNWPIVSVSSVGVMGRAISPSVMGNVGMPGVGYTIGDQRSAPQSLDLWGGDLFWYRAPCQVIYRAGFQTSVDMVIPPAPTDPASDYATLTPTEGGQWIGDQGVEIDGVDAVKVSGNPATGQYAVDDWGNYTFNAAADNGKTATLHYDYAPWSIAQAVTELIGEWYKRKDRIGLLSKTLGGQETVTFSQKDMNDSIRGALQPYMNVIPA